MPKKREPPPPQHQTQRRRFTENASASMVAESNDVWHSTRIDIDESSLQLGEPEVSIRRGRSKGRKENNNPVSAVPHDPGLARGRGNARGRGLDKPPVIINQPIGHPFFTEKLQLCGYVIRQPVASNELFYEMMNFRKKLADWLIENEDEMKRVETDTSKFLKALNSYLTDTENFKLAMKPTKHKTELVQPSLLHCLLGIETLQAKVISIIMPLLGEAALSTSEEDTQLVNTILNQLKWLPSIVEGQKFSDNLMSVVDNAVFNSQSLIIKELPNILPSHLHPQVAEKLLEKFSDQGLQLNIPLMDCFSSLEIPEGFWSSIRNTAVDQMTSAPLRDIPAYFSFVFRLESISSLSEVITTIREKVEFTSESSADKNNAYQVEILEKVGFCITTNPAIVNVWTKQVKEDLGHNLTEAIKKIDVIMLLTFAESHKSAVDVLKLLFVERKLAVKLFSQMLIENTAMVNYLFPTISKMLDSLMRTKDSKCSETVQEITIKLFLGLTPMEAQTLMGNMTSIFVNFPPSRDLVLSILTRLAEKEPKKLLLFAPHLMSVLEHLMQFPGRQIKALMNILAILSQTEARHSAGEMNHFNAEFSILLRKQLTHSDIKIRCFGVFGALATIRRMAGQDPQDNEGIKELLKLAWSTVERDEDACCIFFDELSESVDALPMDICTQFCEVLKSKFQKLWTLDAADTEKTERFAQKAGLALVSTFDANRECSEDRLVIIFENQALEMNPLVIPAHLRVLAALEGRVKNNHLVGIDALLGCPLLFPEIEEYFDRDSMSLIGYNQRNNLGQYLVLAINFFRESVSAFINEEDSELRIKLWLRLENILKLQKLLVRHFDSFPYLPYAYIADKTIGLSRDGAGPSGLQAFRMNKTHKPGVKATKSGAKRQAVPKKSGKKKARREEPAGSEDDGEQDPNVTNVSVSHLPSAGAKKVSKINLDEEIQPKKIASYIRRFDTTVFRLLRYPLRCDDDPSISFSRILSDISSVSQNPSRIAQVEKFTPETLALLLVELKHQLTDDRCKLSVFSVKKFLIYVCRQINTIVAALSDNEESGSFTTENLTKLECCLRLLIGLMTSYFESVKKLDKEEQDVKFAEAIELLARQTTNSEDDVVLSSQAEILANMSSYLGHLVSFIKNPATAVDHLKLLKILHDLLNGKAEMKRAIDEAARVYLRNEWKLPSAQVDGFLKIWLGTTPTPIKVIKHLAKKLLTEESESEDSKIPNSSMYKACTDANFHVWYNAMFYGLSQYVHKNLRRRGDFEDSIREWNNAVHIFNDLVEVTRKVHRNLILISCLRNCRLFLESFISGGAELLPKFCGESNQDALRFCKILQTPCRRIQYICEHSKKKADVQLIKSVPMVKKVLETLIFRVREVLIEVPGGGDAFWMGNLQHRDLGGQRIHSQVVASSDDLLFSSDEDDDIDDAPLSASIILNDNGSDEENEQPEQEEMDVVEDASVEESDYDEEAHHHHHHFESSSEEY